MSNEISLKLRKETCGVFYISSNLLQGEAFNTADPELVVCILTGQSGHIHKEVLGLGGGSGRRLA